MKAVRIITTTGKGQGKIIEDIREVPVTQYSLATRSGYINKTLGKAIQDALLSVNNGLADNIQLEVIK